MAASLWSDSSRRRRESHLAACVEGAKAVDTRDAGTVHLYGSLSITRIWVSEVHAHPLPILHAALSDPSFGPRYHGP
jgi:hypothetical protein